MNINNKSIIIIILFILSGIPVFAMSPKEIVQKVIERDDGKTQISQVTLSTFRYIKKDSQIVMSETPRVKVMDVIRKNVGYRNKDTKVITLIKEPAGERGIGFLQYDYYRRGKETDQWMYFSALGKVKRIISGNEDEPKSGSFFGSELNYEDVEERRLDDYSYKQIAVEKYHDRPCRVIENIPTNERAKRSNYSKIWTWIDQERYLILKTILFNRQGQKVKRITTGSIDNINGIWVVRKLQVNSLLTGRMTQVSYDSIAFNIKVADDFLTQRTLTDSAFRERYIKQYREYIK